MMQFTLVKPELKKTDNWVLQYVWVFGKRVNSKDQLVDCLTKIGASCEKLFGVEIVIVNSIKKQKTQTKTEKNKKREKNAMKHTLVDVYCYWGW